MPPRRRRFVNLTPQTYPSSSVVAPSSSAPTSASAAGPSSSSLAAPSSTVAVSVPCPSSAVASAAAIVQPTISAVDNMAHKKSRSIKNAPVKGKFKGKGKGKKKAQPKAKAVRDPSPLPSVNEHDSHPTKRKRVHSTQPVTEAEPEPNTVLTEYEMPDHPTDNLKGSMRLGLHSAYSRRLEERLNQLAVDYTAVVTSTRELLDHIEEWKAAWGGGQ
ncbi:hypothetical protein N7478_004628 [Penicillium angulare]|uniref:uncharacterized protein n=1 Tax=Penicillium angulare TaxID=116970 RepID=UPI00253F8819|nr:uncharacterized protein N7478_004628 [Penicillium angulare]KAJ5279256.1 hypothetical protein N7478_004628 [Penicillium angulare]